MLKVIPIPGTTANVTNGKLYSFDISWVDQETQTYYLADRSNNVIDVVDAKTDTFLGQIPGGFAGAAVVNGSVNSDLSGPNGVASGGHCLFATDTRSGGRVVSFDLRASFPPPVVSSVSTGGTARADELAYDPRDGLLLVMNPGETPPYGTFISVNTSTCGLTVRNQVLLDAAHGVTGNATGGAEQPVWDPATGLFYLTLPQIGATATHGGIVSIPPLGTQWTVLGNGIDFCGPNGLTLGPGGDLFAGCGTVYDTAGNVWNSTGTVTAAPNDIIVDARTGKIEARVLGVGAGDEVWFNAGDGNYYATGSGSPFRPTVYVATTPPTPLTAQGSTPLGVVDAEDEKVLQLVTTFNVPAVGTGNSSTEHPAGTAHSVAANAANNQIFVPLAANNAFLSPDGKQNCLTGCVAVFGHPDENASGD